MVLIVVPPAKAQTASVVISLNGLGQRYGISVHRASSSTLLDQFAAAFPTYQLQKLAACSVTVENAGISSIRGFTIKYVIVPSPAAAPVIRQFTYSGRPGHEILSGTSSRLITPVHWINDSLMHKTPSPTVPTQVTGELARATSLCSAMASISISLDSISFYDNTLDGPDEVGILSRLNTRTQASKAFLADLSKQLQIHTSDTSAVLSWLKSEQGAKVFVDKQTHQLDWMTASRKHMASRYLHLLSANGTAGIGTQIQQDLSAIPPIVSHR